MKTQIPKAVKDYLTRLAALGGHARARKLSKKRRAEISKAAGIASGKARRKLSTMNGNKHPKLKP